MQQKQTTPTAAVTQNCFKSKKNKKEYKTVKKAPQQQAAQRKVRRT